MWNVFILEDNIFHSTYLEKHIAIILKSMGIEQYSIKQYNDLTNFYHNIPIKVNDNDVFMVDIDLHSKFNGIQLADKIRKLNNNCFIIFCTSNPYRSLEALNNQILPADYIVKNSNGSLNIEDQLKNAFQAIKKIIATRTTEDEMLTFQWGANTMTLFVKDFNYICALKGKKRSVQIVTKYEEYIVGKSISEIKMEIGNKNRWIYKELRSYIINTQQINFINRKDSVILFNDGSELYLGVRIIDKLRAFMGYSDGNK